MTVPSVSTQVTQSASLVKSAESIEVPFELAMANLEIIGKVLGNQWLYTDLTEKKITTTAPWSRLWAWWNPAIEMSLVQGCVDAVKKTMESGAEADKPKQFLVREMHQLIAGGFARLSETFKRPFPKISSELSEVLTQWSAYAPTEKQLKVAKVFSFKKDQEELRKKPKTDLSVEELKANLTSQITDSAVFQKRQATVAKWEEAQAAAAAEKPVVFAKKAEVKVLSPQEEWKNRTQSSAVPKPIPTGVRSGSYQDSDQFKAALQGRREKMGLKVMVRATKPVKAKAE